MKVHLRQDTIRGMQTWLVMSAHGEIIYRALSFKNAVYVAQVLAKR